MLESMSYGGRGGRWGARPGVEVVYDLDILEIRGARVGVVTDGV